MQYATSARGLIADVAENISTKTEGNKDKHNRIYSLKKIQNHKSQDKLISAIQLHSHTITDQNLQLPASKLKLTSNMTFLRRAFNMIGSLYNGNIQFLPFKKPQQNNQKINP